MGEPSRGDRRHYKGRMYFLILFVDTTQFILSTCPLTFGQV
jgi:hypothetical protein